MKRKDIKLIKMCLKHKWIPIVYGDELDAGPDNCALCNQYFDAGCYGCPVNAKTGKTACRGSPYEKWDAAFHASVNELLGTVDYIDLMSGKMVIDARTQRAAIDECVFLNELLPPEERLDLGDM